MKIEAVCKEILSWRHKESKGNQVLVTTLSISSLFPDNLYLEEFME
jgi:hypothetical protein